MELYPEKMNYVVQKCQIPKSWYVTKCFGTISEWLGCQKI